MKLQKVPPDEFSVSHVNILYNYEADIMYCILEAPSREAVEKHHAKLGSKRNSIIEIRTTA